MAGRPGPMSPEAAAELRERLRAGRAAARARRQEAIEMPITERPGFQDAVDQAVAEATKKILSELAAILPHTAAERFDPNALAMSIAELTDQGSGMKRLPPEIKMARDAATKRMNTLLAEARAQGHVPVYQLVAKTVLPTSEGETLIEPLQRGRDNIVRPTKIRWPLVPNLAMEPVDEWAERIMAAFRESIGNQGAAEVGVETNIGLTDQGHVVTGGAIQQRKDRSGGAHLGVVIDEAGNQAGGPNNGGPPYVDVRVLGSIAAPARQNG